MAARDMRLLELDIAGMKTPMGAAVVIAREPPTAAARIGRERAVAYWLFGCCGMIFVMVVLGGVTRLTVSGLSITEWQPVTGALPPLSHAAWLAEFEKYRHIPQYQLLNPGMSLDDFKYIYLWEYAHRLWGRLIGFAYAVPFVYFVWRRLVPRRWLAPLAAILALGFAQGGLGWYMVESGLADRVEVSQYRLVAHLALALLIYAATLWVALGVLAGREHSVPGPRPNALSQTGQGDHPAPTANPQVREGVYWRRASEIVLLLVALTIAAGGFVAGLHAGLTYNSFPLMDGNFVPAGYGQLQPFILNWFENIPAVQFDHRLLAETTVAVVLLLWLTGRRAALPHGARIALRALLAAALLQFALGVATLLLVVPLPLAAAHQAGALLLLTAAIAFRHALRPAKLDLARAASI